MTALHNHFFWEEPRILYVHGHGHGSAADLARSLKPALDRIGKGSRPAATASSQPPAGTGGTLDTAKIAANRRHAG